MVAAEFAAAARPQGGRRRAGRVSGDCLWIGLRPEQEALLAAGRSPTTCAPPTTGIEPVGARIDRGSVWKRINAVQREIASTDDNPQRFVDMGIDIVCGSASSQEKNTVRVGDQRTQTRYVLLCLGSRPAVPPVNGLEDTGFITSQESLFELEDRQPAS